MQRRCIRSLKSVRADDDGPAEGDQQGESTDQMPERVHHHASWCCGVTSGQDCMGADACQIRLTSVPLRSDATSLLRTVDNGVELGLGDVLRHVGHAERGQMGHEGAQMVARALQ